MEYLNVQDLYDDKLNELKNSVFHGICELTKEVKNKKYGDINLILNIPSVDLEMLIIDGTIVKQINIYANDNSFGYDIKKSNIMSERKFHKSFDSLFIEELIKIYKHLYYMRSKIDENKKDEVKEEKECENLKQRILMNPDGSVDGIAFY